MKFLILLFIFLTASLRSQARDLQIITAEIPPYTSSETSGLIIEIVNEMANIVGYKNGIQFLPWKRALEYAQIKSADRDYLIIPLNRSPERVDKFKWISELYVDETVLIGKKGSQVNSNIEKILNRPVGVLAGSPLEAQLKRLGFSKISGVHNESMNAKKLHHGRIDIWHAGKMVALDLYRKEGYKTSELEFGASLDKNDLYLAANLDFPEEKAQLWRSALEKIKADGRYDKIVNAFLKKLGFKKEEQSIGH